MNKRRNRRINRLKKQELTPSEYQMYKLAKEMNGVVVAFGRTMGKCHHIAQILSERMRDGK